RAAQASQCTSDLSAENASAKMLLPMADGDHAVAVEPLNIRSEGTIGSLREFLRSEWRRVAIVSLLVLTPCLWQARMVAGDLSSHLYNAWLVPQVLAGKLPGLWIAPQHQNILVDVLLQHLLPVIGADAAARVALSLCVLVFFWGAFAMTC